MIDALHLSKAAEFHFDDLCARLHGLLLKCDLTVLLTREEHIVRV
jgi:hypothetical protein